MGQEYQNCRCEETFDSEHLLTIQFLLILLLDLPNEKERTTDSLSLCHVGVGRFFDLHIFVILSWGLVETNKEINQIMSEKNDRFI